MDCCSTNTYSFHHFSNERCGRADGSAGDQVQDSFDAVSELIAKVKMLAEGCL